MATYYKPQSPIQSGKDFIYPLTTSDQIMKSDRSRRLEQNGLIVADNSASLGGISASDYALKTDTAPDSSKLGGIAARDYALKTDTAPDSSKLGGKAPEYYIQPRNLLDNSDFRNPVNQRGKTNYTGGGYTIDRWVLGINSVVVNVLDDGIEVTGGDSTYNAPYIQKVPENLTGKTVTLAVCDSDGVIETATGTVQTDSTCSTNTTYGSIAFYHASSDGTLWTQINVNYGGSKIFRWAALYEGSYTAETLPPYVPKGYAAELAECQRYYELLNSGCSQFIRPYNSKYIAIAVEYQTKRVAPTISVKGSLTNALIVAGVGSATPTSIEATYPIGKKSTRINCAGSLNTSNTYSINYNIVKLEINADL